MSNTLRAMTEKQKKNMEQAQNAKAWQDRLQYGMKPCEGEHVQYTPSHDMQFKHRARL